MGEQIDRYTMPYCNDYPECDRTCDQEFVLASDHDREIAQRDARIGELEIKLGQALHWKEQAQRDYKARVQAQAERDTAREMLRKYGAHHLMCGTELGDACTCGLDQFLAALPKETAK
jgi:hypothetical protein